MSHFPTPAFETFSTFKNMNRKPNVEKYLLREASASIPFVYSS